MQLRQLTDMTMDSYYDFEYIKDEENICVWLGSKKKDCGLEELPQNIVYKQGAGAKIDCDVTCALEYKLGKSNILAVIHKEKDYFIREAYSSEALPSSWDQLTEYKNDLMMQAISLSVSLLKTGYIDKDRKIMPAAYEDDNSITMRNIIITDKGKMIFFDFEPEYKIDWHKSEFTEADKTYLSVWQKTYEGIINQLAQKFNLDPEPYIGMLQEQVSQFLELNAGKEMWKDLLSSKKSASEVEEDLSDKSEYIPPALSAAQGEKSAFDFMNEPESPSPSSSPTAKKS
ncbi:MAG: hypothetical protein ACYCQI_02645 [Gammaproteobacteria bacterium]